MECVICGENETKPYLQYCQECYNEALERSKAERSIHHMKFRKKPIVIEAIQWNGNSNKIEIENFIGKNLKVKIYSDTAYTAGQAPPYFSLFIETLEGIMQADPFDWIIKGVNGEFYPCKPDIFEKTYEKVDERD